MKKILHHTLPKKRMLIPGDVHFPSSALIRLRFKQINRERILKKLLDK